MVGQRVLVPSIGVRVPIPEHSIRGQRQEIPFLSLRKKYRNKLGVSQDKLSKLADVTYNTIIKIESGANINPTIETLSKIAKALGVGVDDLIK